MKSPMRPSLALCLLLFSATGALAHGVTLEHSTGTAIVATASYADGEPIAGSPWFAVPPGTDDPFARGVTDGRGRLAFQPDRPGEWSLVVRTADGHGATRRVTVDATLATVVGGPGTGRTTRIVVGLAAVAATTLLLNALLRRRAA